MPSRGRKFINEFLLPNLNQKIFGTRLMWLDIENKVFQIQWNHKSAQDWTTSDAAVFAAWDKKRGHYNPDNKEYYPKSKQRFRAALYKFIKQKHITELCSKDKNTKIYCIGDANNLSETYITGAKTNLENAERENSQKKVKQNLEDLVIDMSSIWNTDLLTELQENCLVPHHYSEIQEEYLAEEQIVTSCSAGLIQDAPDYENPQNYILSLNNKNLPAIKTLSTIKETEDMESLYIESHFETKTCNYKNDNNMKKPTTTENDNFHDYLRTVTDTYRRGEYLDHEFHDIDDSYSIDLPLPCI